MKSSKFAEVVAKSILFLQLISLCSCNYVEDEELEDSDLFKRLQKYQDLDLHHKPLMVNSDSENSSKSRDDLGTVARETVRLPTHVVPLHYHISLQVYQFKNGSFLGHVDLDFRVLNNTRTIVMHAMELTMPQHLMKVTDVENNTIKISQVTEMAKSQMINLTTDTTLKPDLNYTLTIHFQGKIRDDGHGLYYFSYVDSSETTRMVVSTQLQATDARYVFPCLDEPSFKTRFSLRLARPVNSTALSNTPLSVTAPFLGFPEYEWDIFQTTVLMPTYLLAFVISQFKSLTKKVNGVEYKVFMKDEHYLDGQYTLDQTPKFLQYFQNFYNLPYPFTKLDSVGLEKMRAAGMENWGLITYNEGALRITNSSTPRNLLATSTLIAHEVAHQWFGNLVTAAWWSDIWLNEGFATYMSLKSIQAVEPEWEAMKLFISGHQMTAMELDQTQMSTPIVKNVSSIIEIEKTFNRITYNKGASLIRMMDHFLTEETFQRGIRNYLNEHKYSNAHQDDLWWHLTKVGQEDYTLPSDVTVKEIMDTWTLQKHYPVINLVRHPNGSCTVSQKQLSDSDNPDTSGLWWIPVSVVTEGSIDVAATTATIWLPPSSKEMFVAGLPNLPRWVLLNNQQAAYARVNYDYASWMAIARQLKQNHTVFPPITRAQLLDDAYHLFGLGELDSPDVLFTLMSYLSNEEEYLPWLITMKNMEEVHNQLLFQPEFFELKTYLLKLSEKLYHQFGFPRNTYASQHQNLFSLRAQKWACTIQQTECVDDLIGFFNDFQNRKDIRVVPSYLRTSVLCTGVKEGNSSLWQSLWTDALAIRFDSRNRYALLNALGCSKEPWTLKRYLHEGFKNHENLGTPGLYSIINSVSKNPISYDYAWDLIKNATKFKERFGFGPLKPSIVKVAVRNLNRERHYQELEQFLAESEYSESQQKKFKNVVSYNIKWLQRFHKPISSWFSQYYPFNDIKADLLRPMPRMSSRSPRTMKITLIRS
ncbi:Peptidase M1 membrane alanine aminopeptidase N-terminal [Trinorchestia longiramus]|nr:Peptidase M1 membrane alanine aminopeptidase N-terminal [Trinorchestia longiramus]